MNLLFFAYSRSKFIVEHDTVRWRSLPHAGSHTYDRCDRSLAIANETHRRCSSLTQLPRENPPCNIPAHTTARLLFKFVWKKSVFVRFKWWEKKARNRQWSLAVIGTTTSTGYNKMALFRTPTFDQVENARIPACWKDRLTGGVCGPKWFDVKNELNRERTRARARASMSEREWDKEAMWEWERKIEEKRNKGWGKVVGGGTRVAGREGRFDRSVCKGVF